MHDVILELQELTKEFPVSELWTRYISELKEGKFMRCAEKTEQTSRR